MKKEINVVHFVMIIVTLIIIEFVAVFLTHENLCEKAICSSDGKNCLIYELNKENKLEIKWRGSCRK